MLKFAAVVSAVLVFCLSSGPARADGFPTPGLAHAIQDGQDVEVRIDIPAYDPPENNYFDWTYQVSRRDEDGEEYVVSSDLQFDMADAIESSEGWDMDGMPFTSYFFDVVDECVPPEVFWYHLSPGSQSDPPYIPVEDTGDACLEQYQDDDAGIGSDGGGDCSVSGVGHDATVGALGLLMLGIGLAGLLVSRRRRS